VKFASFEAAALSSWGLVEGDEIVDVGQVLRGPVAELVNPVRDEA